VQTGHRSFEEIHLFLSGMGKMRLDGEEVDVTPSSHEDAVLPGA